MAEVLKIDLMFSTSYMCSWLLYQCALRMQPPYINYSPPPPLPPVAPCDSPQRGAASREDQTVSTVYELHLIVTCRCLSCLHGCHLTWHCGTFAYLNFSDTPWIPIIYPSHIRPHCDASPPAAAAAPPTGPDHTHPAPNTAHRNGSHLHAAAGAVQP